MILWYSGITEVSQAPEVCPREHFCAIIKKVANVVRYLQTQKTMIRKVEFANDQYYHVLNRGIDNRDIFLNFDDYFRFVESLKEFNTSLAVSIRDLRDSRLPRGLSLGKSSRSPRTDLGARPSSELNKLVEILCFCLLPNHFHLLLKQLRENGISEFMKKIGTGYASFINIKYKRKGHLFQGAFKAVHISKESQFLHITRYAHLNVLDLYMPEWREGKVSDWEKSKKILEEYPWSSYPIFVGKKISDFCNPEILKEVFHGPKDYESFVKEWAERDLKEIQNLILE